MKSTYCINMGFEVVTNFAVQSYAKDISKQGQMFILWMVDVKGCYIDRKVHSGEDTVMF